MLHDHHFNSIELDDPEHFIDPFVIARLGLDERLDHGRSTNHHARYNHDLLRLWHYTKATPGASFFEGFQILNEECGVTDVPGIGPVSNPLRPPRPVLPAPKDSYIGRRWQIDTAFMVGLQEALDRIGVQYGKDSPVYRRHRDEMNEFIPHAVEVWCVLGVNESNISNGRDLNLMLMDLWRRDRDPGMFRNAYETLARGIERFWERTRPTSRGDCIRNPYPKTR